MSRDLREYAVMRLQPGTLHGDIGFCGHGRLLHSNRHRLVQSRHADPLFAQQFVMAAGSHEHGGAIIANP